MDLELRSKVFFRSIGEIPNALNAKGVYSRAMRLTATNSDSPTMISPKSALLNNSLSFAMLLSAAFILPSL